MHLYALGPAPLRPNVREHGEYLPQFLRMALMRGYQILVVRGLPVCSLVVPFLAFDVLRSPFLSFPNQPLEATAGVPCCL